MQIHNKKQRRNIISLFVISLGRLFFALEVLADKLMALRILDNTFVFWDQQLSHCILDISKPIR